MRRLVALALLSVLILNGSAIFSPASAAGAQDDAPVSVLAAPPVRIAVLDTGIDFNHTEFNAGQVVAWWDFTTERKTSAQTNPFTVFPTATNPPANRSWDPFVGPWDSHGHGTATASLAAGNNRGNCGFGLGNNKLSFAPGFELIIGKVGNAAGSIPGDVGAAIRWAREQGASVISMSFGVPAPLPLHSYESDMRNAHAAGIMFVVSAGNGAGNLGAVPYPSWSSAYGNSQYALSVGGGVRTGGTLASTTGNTDPDVTSWSDGVCVARRLSVGGGYAKMSGTSFSGPLVAGIAAGALQIARDNAVPMTPAQLERLLLLSASNSIYSPYAREGMGFLLDNQWPTVAAHAAAGTLPNYDAQGDHAVADRQYHDIVTKGLRNWQV